MGTPYVPNDAEKKLLDAIVAANKLYKIDLYQNNHTPVAGDLAAQYTVASYSGYAQQTPTWSAAATDSDDHAYTLSSTITFPLASSGSQTVYGWYITDSSGNLIQARLFDASVSVTTSAGVAAFVVKFVLYQGP